MKNISQTDIKNILLARPSMGEQGKVATVLDRSNSQIDALSFEAQKLRQLKVGLMGDLLCVNGVSSEFSKPVAV